MCSGMKLANDLLKVIRSPHDFTIGWREAFDFCTAAQKHNQGEGHGLIDHDLFNFRLCQEMAGCP